MLLDQLSKHDERVRKEFVVWIPLDTTLPLHLQHHFLRYMMERLVVTVLHLPHEEAELARLVIGLTEVLHQE